LQLLPEGKPVGRALSPGKDHSARLSRGVTEGRMPSGGGLPYRPFIPQSAEAAMEAKGY
jgi:hypothetical protein